MPIIANGINILKIFWTFFTLPYRSFYAHPKNRIHFLKQALWTALWKSSGKVVFCAFTHKNQKIGRFCTAGEVHICAGRRMSHLRELADHMWNAKFWWPLTSWADKSTYRWIERRSRSQGGVKRPQGRPRKRWTVMLVAHLNQPRYGWERTTPHMRWRHYAEWQWRDSAKSGKVLFSTAAKYQCLLAAEKAFLCAFSTQTPNDTGRCCAFYYTSDYDLWPCNLQVLWSRWFQCWAFCCWRQRCSSYDTYDSPANCMESTIRRGRSTRCRRRSRCPCRTYRRRRDLSKRDRMLPKVALYRNQAIQW